MDIRKQDNPANLPRNSNQFIHTTTGGSPAGNVSVVFIAGYDPLKLAYTMLTSGLFAVCKCLWVNDKPAKYKGRSLIPVNAYTETFFTDTTIGTFKAFAIANKRNNRAGLHCVGTLNERSYEYFILFASEATTMFTIWFCGEPGEFPERMEKKLKVLEDRFHKLFAE